jgi:thiol-disulfide isomerase/thioredoxin
MDRTATENVKRVKRRRSGVAWKVLLIFVVVTFIGALVEWRRPPELVAWRDDLTRAQAEAGASNKLLLAYFWAEWCGPCHTLSRTTWADARVKEALGTFVSVKIDVDQQPEVARRFSVSAIPRIILLDRTGNVLGSKEGLVEPEALVQWLADVSARQSPVSVETRK